MVECQCCGHDVVCTYTILEKYRRFWLDLAQQVLFSSGLCQSLRQMSQQWSAVLGSSVGLRTINDRINQMEPLLRQARSEPLGDMPAVVQFDGIWLHKQIQTEAVKLDKRGRKRKKRKGKKVVLLLALGLWTDGSGKREILDWQVADGESKAAWEPFVHRLWERGLRPENGLQAVIRDGCGELGEAIAWVYGTTVIEQRCIFHKLRNLADKCREELKGEANKETRKQLMEQASALYQAERAQKPEHIWRPLPSSGEREPRKPWQRSSAILSRPLPTMRWMAWHANSSAPPHCWSVPTGNCGASFARCVALAVRQGLRSPSIFRSNGSMLVGRSKLGGILLAHCISTCSISTLSKGYVTGK